MIESVIAVGMVSVVADVMVSVVVVILSVVAVIVSVLINWVCWVRGNFSGGPGHVYVSCVSPLVECRAGTSIFGHCGGVDGGTVRIFFLLF